MSVFVQKNTHSHSPFNTQFFCISQNTCISITVVSTIHVVAATDSTVVFGIPNVLISCTVHHHITRNAKEAYCLMLAILSQKSTRSVPYNLQQSITSYRRKITIAYDWP
jgi:hypothetical protein